MTLPPIPDEAVRAVLRTFLPDGSVHEVAEAQWAREDLAAAWPFLYAAALDDFADRIDRARELIGPGDDPFGFVVANAHLLAYKAREGAREGTPQ